MLLSFYHGSRVPIGESTIHWNYVIRNSQDPSNQTNHHNFMLGPFLLIASPVCWAVWFILQVIPHPLPYLIHLSLKLKCNKFFNYRL